MWKKFDSIDNLKKCKTFKELFGTVKLHGTNGSIIFNKDGFEVYSRTQKLSENNTNNGFYQFVIENLNDLKDLRSQFSAGEVIIYGEYAGDGINKGAAICYTPRKFYVFKILADVYEKIISENKDAEIINELLKIFFSAGYIKGTKDTQDFLS